MAQREISALVSGEAPRVRHYRWAQQKQWETLDITLSREMRPVDPRITLQLIHYAPPRPEVGHTAPVRTCRTKGASFATHKVFEVSSTDHAEATSP